MAFVKLERSTKGCDLWEGTVTCECGQIHGRTFAGGEIALYLSANCPTCGTLIKFLCPPRPDRRVVTAEVQVVE